jgi:hypothetical protein
MTNLMKFQLSIHSLFQRYLTGRPLLPKKQP